MRNLLGRALVAAGAAVAVLMPATVAIASGAPADAWSPTTSPGSFSYGTLTAGQAVSQVFTLTNSGRSATGMLKITLSGSSAFSTTADSCTGTSLGPKKACHVTIKFAPAAPGQNDSATLVATASKTAIASLALTGASAKASPVLATSPGAGGTVGTATVTDTAALSGGSSPTGSVEFKLYGPSTAATCSGTPVDDETVPVTGDGSYTTPAGATPTQAGTYWWTASYSGDTQNNSAASGCGTESVTIAQAAPALATSPSTGGTAGGTPVTDTATLTGGDSPGGTIEFQAYGPSPTPDCSGTPVDDETVPVTGNGTYTTPDGFTAAKAGSYWWTASYSGDANNAAVASGCDQEPVTITPASPALATSPAQTGSGTVGGTTATDAATLSGGSAPTGTIEFQAYGPSPTADCSGTPVDDETVNVTGNGTYKTPDGFAPAAAGVYWWTASYSGDTNNNQAVSGCGQESVTINPASPAITTSPGPGGPTGTTVTDKATLSGGDSPTGAITFNLYGPSLRADCSGPAVDTETVPVTGDGSYTTPTGATPATEGTYWWTASYSGDGNNNTVASGCGSEQVNVGPHLYWTNALTGAIYRGNLNGSGVTTLVTGQQRPQLITVSGGRIYWADVPNNGGTIMSANLDGSGVTTLVTGQDLPRGVAVDGSHIYWCNGPLDSGAVMEANLDGTGVTDLIDGGTPTGIAVDSSHIYWADESTESIMEANLDGTGVTTLVSGQFDPIGVAVDSGHIYWVDEGSGRVMKANLDGTGVTTLVSGQDIPYGVAVDSSNIYWATEQGGTIMAANLDGSGVTTLVSGTIFYNGVAIGP